MLVVLVISALILSVIYKVPDREGKHDSDSATSSVFCHEIMTISKSIQLYVQIQGNNEENYEKGLGLYVRRLTAI